MIASQEFRQHAAECRRMARFTHDKAVKQQWIHLADRWVLCAELAELTEHAVNAKHAEKKNSKPDRSRLTH